MKSVEQKVVSKNKKAWFQYEVLEKFVAGIVLSGSEVKSLKMGKINFVDSYCVFINNELYLKGLHIAGYTHGGYSNHEPVHDRKLLLNRKELSRLQKKVKEKGFTIIPLQCIINAKGLIKIEIAVTRGKKTYDKRESLKKKESRREEKRGAEQEK